MCIIRESKSHFTTQCEGHALFTTPVADVLRANWYSSGPKMAKMGKKKRATLCLVVLWLLFHVPATPFFLERPHLVSSAEAYRIEAGRGPRASSNLLLPLSYSEGHINRSLADADLSRFLNPVVILHTLGAIVVAVAVIGFVLYILLIIAFWACHLGVHSAIVLHERRQIPHSSPTVKFMRYNYNSYNIALSYN